MNSIFTWVILGLIVAMLVIMAMNRSRQKKSDTETQKMLGELKPGDKVKTFIGVYGKIVSITETTDGKVCIIETGDKDKTRMEVDMRVVAGRDTKQIAVYDENNNLISLDGKPVELPKVDDKNAPKEEQTTEEKSAKKSRKKSKSK